jgi:hypothetical protein
MTDISYFYWITTTLGESYGLLSVLEESGPACLLVANSTGVNIMHVLIALLLCTQLITAALATYLSYHEHVN